MKKTLYAKRAHSTQLVILLIIFILMKKRISSEYVPRMKVPSVLIFADLMHYYIVIIQNTQKQYFDNLISKAGVLSNDSAIMLLQRQCGYASSLPTYVPDLAFCQNNKMENDSNLQI